MPGFLFRPAKTVVPCRTLIMSNGSDGPMTRIWLAVSAGGVARGYNVLIFDGPGQQSMLFERGAWTPPSTCSRPLANTTSPTWSIRSRLHC